MLLYKKFGGPDSGFSPPDYLVLAGQRELFASIGAFTNVELDLSGSITPERVTWARLTASLFHTLGVDAILGRSFTQVEDQEGVAVTLTFRRELHSSPRLALRERLFSQRQ